MVHGQKFERRSDTARQPATPGTVRKRVPPLPVVPAGKAPIISCYPLWVQDFEVCAARCPVRGGAWTGQSALAVKRDGGTISMHVHVAGVGRAPCNLPMQFRTWPHVVGQC